MRAPARSACGPVFHTIGFGTQFGTQTGIDVRNTGLFPNGTNTEVDSAFAPTYFGPISFVHQFPGFFSPGITTPDSNSKYTLHTKSFYARDTIEITRYLQLLPAFRVDRFNETALDMNTNTLRNRIDFSCRRRRPRSSSRSTPCRSTTRTWSRICRPRATSSARSPTAP